MSLTSLSIKATSYHPFDLIGVDIYPKNPWVQTDWVSDLEEKCNKIVEWLAKGLSDNQAFMVPELQAQKWDSDVTSEDLVRYYEIIFSYLEPQLVSWFEIMEPHSDVPLLDRSGAESDRFYTIINLPHDKNFWFE